MTKPSPPTDIRPAVLSAAAELMQTSAPLHGVTADRIAQQAGLHLLATRGALQDLASDGYLTVEDDGETLLVTIVDRETLDE